MTSTLKPFSWIDLVLVLALSAVLAAIVIPNWIEARKQDNESSALDSLRSITSAQAIYRERSPNQRYGTLAQLGQAHFIDPVLATGTKDGYRFLATASATHPSYAFDCVAQPCDKNSGNRYFHVDQSGLVHYSTQAFRNYDQARSCIRLGPGGK